MRDIFTVFGFTLRDGLRKKAFLVTTVIVLVVIVLACALVGLFGGSDGGEEPGDGQPSPGEKTDICYFIDENGLIPGAVDTLNAAFGQINFVSVSPSEREARLAEVEGDSSKSVVEVLPGTPLPSLRVYATNILSGVPAGNIADVAKAVYVSGVLAGAGVDEALAAVVTADMAYDMQIVGKMDLSGYILGMLLTMIIFFAVYYYGYGVAMSVASEKTSRVMETLVVSAKPSRILLGKCLAMGVLGLIQLTLFLVVGAVCFQLFVPADFTIAGMPLALSSFTVSSALLILLYFVLGYALYAMLNSVCGATVSRAEDLNSAMMPTMLLSLVSFYVAFTMMFLPNAGLKRIVTYIPFTAPFIMPFRLLNETVSATDIAISVGLLVVGIVLIAAVSIRLYAASVLHYGQRLKLRDFFKLHH